MSHSFDRSTSSQEESPGAVSLTPITPVTLEWTRNGMLILGLVDDEDPAIDVRPYLERSHDYRVLTGRLKTLQGQYPEKGGVPLERQIKGGYRICAVKGYIAAFEKNVRRLVILKDAVSFDSPLLQEVKQCVENAAFSKANEKLDNLKLKAEQTLLLTAKKDASMEPDELENSLRINATCFFLKALVRDLDMTGPQYSTPGEFFECSINSYEFSESLFEYCIWYQKICGGNKIEPLYRHLIDTGKPGTSRYAALALHNLAVMYKESREPKKAEEKFLNALAFYRNAERNSPGSFTPYIAATLANLAVLTAEDRALSERERHEKAGNLYRESIDLFRNCAKIDARKYLPVLVKNLTKYAVVLRKKKDFVSAARCYDETIAMYMALRKTSNDRYQPFLFEALSESVDLSFQTDTPLDALEDCLEALVICRELARSNPGTYLPHLAKTLRCLAIIHTEANAPDLAEAEFREAVSIYRSLRKLPYRKNPSTLDLAQVLNDLGALYMHMNRSDLAKCELLRSLAFYESFPGSPFNPFDMSRVMLNLSTLHQKLSPDKEKSREFASKIVYILRPFIPCDEFSVTLSREAEEILHYWGIPEHQWNAIIQGSWLVNKLR